MICDPSLAQRQFEDLAGQRDGPAGVIARSADIWWQMLALHVLFAAIVTGFSVFLHADLYLYLSFLVGAACGIAFGLQGVYLQAPVDIDVGINGLVVSLTQRPDPQRRRAYQDALRPFGRRWVWLGAVIPIAFLAVGHLITIPVRADPGGARASFWDVLTGVVGLAAMEAASVYIGGWAWQLLAIARSGSQKERGETPVTADAPKRGNGGRHRRRPR